MWKTNSFIQILKKSTKNVIRTNWAHSKMIFAWLKPKQQWNLEDTLKRLALLIRISLLKAGDWYFHDIKIPNGQGFTDRTILNRENYLIFISQH